MAFILSCKNPRERPGGCILEPPCILEMEMQLMGVIITVR